jgi:hypothetical protein
VQTFEVVESYLHRAAKAVVVDWLRQAASEAEPNCWFTLDPVHYRPNRPGPYFGIWPEYPITKDGTGSEQLWDECGDADPWAGTGNVIPPTPSDVVRQGMRLAAVLDIAVCHKGRVGAAVEIVHKHPTPKWKRALLDRLSIDLIEVCATRVMHQVERPKRLPLFTGRRPV